MSTAAFSIESFDQLIDSGSIEVDEGCRLELIRGAIRMMTPAASPEHDVIIDFLNEWSIVNVPRDRVQVRTQNSLGLPGLDSVLTPDVAWVERGNYRETRPAGRHVLLAIEAASSSLARDRGQKASIYAEAGVADYWIVNLREQVVEVHRRPRGDVYSEITAYGKGDAIAPLALPEIKLAVVDLWRDA